MGMVEDGREEDDDDDNGKTCVSVQAQCCVVIYGSLKTIRYDFLSKICSNRVPSNGSFLFMSFIKVIMKAAPPKRADTHTSI